jgi:hypothetical protein
LLRLVLALREVRRQGNHQVPHPSFTQHDEFVQVGCLQCSKILARSAFDSLEEFPCDLVDLQVLARRQDIAVDDDGLDDLRQGAESQILAAGRKEAVGLDVLHIRRLGQRLEQQAILHRLRYAGSQASIHLRIRRNAVRCRGILEIGLEPGHEDLLRRESAEPQECRQADCRVGRQRPGIGGVAGPDLRLDLRL